MIINITETESMLLYDVLWSHHDDGPAPNGWQSKEMVSLRNKINRQIYWQASEQNKQKLGIVDGGESWTQ